MNYRALILFVFGIVCLTDLQAQEDLYLQDERLLKGVIYRKERAADIRIHTNGWALSYNTGDVITYRRSKFYHLELGYVKDPREQKQTRNLSFLFNTGSTAFKLGKQNSVFALRGGVGRRYYISEKARRKGVALGYAYEFGPSLAIVKPYYLDLLYQVEKDGQTSVEVRSEKYSQDNAEKFLSFDQVFGSSGFTKGLKEASIIPGGQGKLGFFFSPGAFDEYIKSVEVGIMGDLFLRPVPIMVETESISNKPYFINLYLHLQLGKRSN